MHNKKGFTFIEMITYLAIFSVMFFVMIPTIKYFSDYVLNLNAKSMTIVIRNAQTTAINNSIDYTICMKKSDQNKQTNNYKTYSSSISNSDLKFEIPFSTLIEDTSFSSGNIRYYSTGKVANGGSIVLRRGTKKVYIIINACIGRARISENKDSQ